MLNKALFIHGLVSGSTLMSVSEVLINAKYQGNPGPWTTATFFNTPGKKTLKWVEVQHPQDVSFNKVARQVWTFCKIFVAACGPLFLEGVPPLGVEQSSSLLCHFTLSDYNQWAHPSPLSFLQEHTGQWPLSAFLQPASTFVITATSHSGKMLLPTFGNTENTHTCMWLNWFQDNPHATR